MIDIISIIVGVVLGVVSLLISVYLFAYYSHNDDKTTGIAIPAKIVVIFGQALGWMQILIIPLDIGQMGSGTTLGVYYGSTILSLILVAFIIPLTHSLYEVDDSISKKQVLISLLYSSVIMAIWCAVIFGTYSSPISKYSNNNEDQQIPLPLYLLFCLGAVGSLLLTLFATYGVIHLPYSLLMIYFKGPQALTPEQALLKKQQLQKRSNDIIQLGEKVTQMSENFNSQQLGWFEKRKRKAEIQSKLNDFKEAVDTLEGEFQVFQEELKATDTPRLYFIGMLLLGGLCFILSFLWIIQAIGTTFSVFTTNTTDGLTYKVAVFPFMDTFLTSLSQSPISFLGTMIYGLMMLYLLTCLANGYSSLSQKLPSIINIYPLTPHKSFTNALLFNCQVVLLGSMGLCCMAVITFNNYVQGSAIGSLFPTENIRLLPVFGFFYGRRFVMSIFSVFLTIYGVIGVGIMLFRHCRKQPQAVQK